MAGNVRTALLRNVAYVMFEDRIFSPAPGGQKIFDHKEVVAMCWDFFDDDFDWEDFDIDIDIDDFNFDFEWDWDNDISDKDKTKIKKTKKLN